LELTVFSFPISSEAASRYAANRTKNFSWRLSAESRYAKPETGELKSRAYS